jgi:hypothetical protein
LAHRRAAACAWLAAALPLVALLAFVAAFRWQPDRHAHFPSIVGDRDAALTLRVAGLLDMSAYLAVAPVVIYLHNRLRSLIGLLTFAGLAYLVLGSLGGTIFATVEPPLFDEGSDAARANSTASIPTAMRATGLTGGCSRQITRRVIGTGRVGSAVRRWATKGPDHGDDEADEGNSTAARPRYATA